MEWVKVLGGTGAQLTIDDANGFLDSLTIKNCFFDGESAAISAIKATNGYFSGDIHIEGTTFKNHHATDYAVIFGKPTRSNEWAGQGKIKTLKFLTNTATTPKGSFEFRGHATERMTSAKVNGNILTSWHADT